MSVYLKVGNTFVPVEQLSNAKERETVHQKRLEEINSIIKTRENARIAEAIDKAKGALSGVPLLPGQEKEVKSILDSAKPVPGDSVPETVTAIDIVEEMSSKYSHYKKIVERRKDLSEDEIKKYQDLYEKYKEKNGLFPHPLDKIETILHNLGEQ